MPPPSYQWSFLIPEDFWNTDGLPYEFFSSSEKKNIRRKIVILPYYAWAFSTSQIFLTHWRVSHKISWQPGTKYFRRKILILFLLSIKFSPYQKISDTQKGCLTKFFVSAVWDGKFSTKPWCPPSYDWKFFMPEIFWNTKGFPRKIVGTIGQKLLNRKQWYPLLMHQSFWCPNFFEAPKCSLAMFFWHCETKNQQNRAAFSSYAWNVSIKGFFWNTEGLRNNFFRHWESNKFRQNSDALPSYAQRFLHQVFFETQIGSHTNLMRTVRQKISARKSW